MDLLITYDRPLIDTYGELYHFASKKLLERGYTVSSLNLGSFIENYDFTDKFLQKFIKTDKPKVIISHLPSLRNSINYITANSLPKNYVSPLEEEIETFFLRNFSKGLQTNSYYFHQRAIEFKEGFVQTMRKENLPFPESILRSEIMKKDWNYDFLSKKLGDNFIIKDITMSKGEGVSLIDKKSKTILDNENIQVAQKRIETTLPSSLRAMTFPNEIIGLFIYYNENDDLRSNYFPGYKKFSLNENILLSNKEKEIALRNGFNENLDLREDVKEAILKVSSIPSQSLLRGLDIIFDANNKFYFLEAQTNPGNSYADTYPLILRKPCGSRAENIQMGAEVIANSLEKYLTNHK